MSKNIELDNSISGLIERIEARASDGRYYAMEDADRETVIKFLKRLVVSYDDIVAPALSSHNRHTAQGE